MPKESNDAFLKEFDRFGQPVSLTYKNNGNYNTPIGGVFTMFAFLIFMSWLAMEVIDVYMPPGKHNVGTSVGVTQKLNSAWPQDQLTQKDFFVAYKLMPGEGTPIPEGEADRYFSALWLQRVNGTVVRAWTGAPCQDLYDEFDVSMMFYEQIKGHWCPNMSDPSPPYEEGEQPVVKIQNPSDANKGGESSDFVFVLDTCDNLKNITDADCESETKSEAALNTMTVSTKIQTQQWNTKNFLRNGREMNSQWQSNEIQLNNKFFQRQAYTLIPNAITFRNSHIINIPYMPKWDPGEKFRAYDVTAPFNSIFMAESVPEELKDDPNPFDTWLSMRFTQDSTTKSISSTREAISNTFQRFGSYLALCLRFIGYILGAYQKFTFDNSMTKKLYNYVHEQEENGSQNPRVPQSDIEFKNNLLTEARDRRKPFKYSGWRFCCKKNFASPWCMCCRF